MKTTINTALTAGAMSLFPYQALAKMSEANAIFGGTSNPIDQFVGFLTGGFAIGVAVIAIVVMGGMIIFGSDFGGFGRRVPMVLLGVGFVIFSVNVVQFLTGSDVSGMMYDPNTLYVSSLAPLPSH